MFSVKGRIVNLQLAGRELSAVPRDPAVIVGRWLWTSQGTKRERPGPNKLSRSRWEPAFAAPWSRTRHSAEPIHAFLCL